MSLPNVTVVDHPLVAHKLSLIRDKETSTAKFRMLMREMGLLLGYEVLRDLPTELRTIETPLTSMQAPFLTGKKVVFVPILRAGMGLLDGLLELVPAARVGHIGLYREPETLVAVEYYMKVPEDIGERMVVLIDPMLATGNSAIAAISRLKEHGVQSMKVLCLLAAPEGISAVHSLYPEIPIVTAAVDSHLDDHGYIVPGLGDAGDRLYGTK